MRMLRHALFCAFDPLKFGGDRAARERFNMAVFVAPDRNFLFVKNEKCANNTARISLQRAASKTPLPAGFNDANRWAAPLLQPSDLGLARLGDINAAARLKFAIVRNPYARTLSAWLDKFASGDPKQEKFERALGGPAPSFGAFVERVCRQAPADMNPHWRVQVDNIYARLIRFDRFVMFERLEEGLGAVMSGLGKPPAIVSIRKGKTSAGARIAAHYTPLIASMVAETFAADFEAFGYPTDLAAAAE